MPVDAILEIEQVFLVQVQEQPRFEGIRIYPDDDIFEVFLILPDPGG